MTTSPTPEPKGYAVTAAELRRIADALDTLPPGDKPPSVQLTILPEHTAEAVDAVALAVFGKPGRDQKIGSDWYHIVHGPLDETHVSVSVQTIVPGPPDERDAEIERLRAELAESRAATETAKSYLGTEGAVSQAKPDTMVQEFTGRASVPDSDSAIYATFLAAEKSDNEQLKAWLDRHGITVVGAPAASLRRALADDHAEALDLNQAQNGGE